MTPARLSPALGLWLFVFLMMVTGRLQALARISDGPTSLAYRLSPLLEHNRFRAIDVQMRFDVPPSGVVRLKAPQGIGRANPSRRVVVTAVHSARLVRTPDGNWMVHAKAGTRVEIDYRVYPTVAHGPTVGSGYADVYAGSDWFQAMGENLFAHPREDAKAIVQFQWEGPAEWTVVTPLDDLVKAGPLTLENLIQTTLIGSRNPQLASRSIRGGVLRVAGVGTWTLPIDRYADQTASVINQQRAFWNDTTGPYTVTLVALDRDGEFEAGVGRDGGFAAYLARNVSESGFRGLVTHEYTHMWIPNRVGRMPEPANEARAYWFSEGFTSFYTSRSMLRTGEWTLQNFVNDFNALTTSYDMSPVRGISNRDAAQGFWKNFDVQGVPYKRGAMLAYLLDARLRARTTGRKNLDDVMRLMRDHFTAHANLDVRTNLMQSYSEEGGGDISDWLKQFIDRGEQIFLPTDIFAGCLTVLEEQKRGIGRVQSVIADKKLAPDQLEKCLHRLGG